MPNTDLDQLLEASLETPETVETPPTPPTRMPKKDRLKLIMKILRAGLKTYVKECKADPRARPPGDSWASPEDLVRCFETRNVHATKRIINADCKSLVADGLIEAEARHRGYRTPATALYVAIHAAREQAIKDHQALRMETEACWDRLASTLPEIKRTYGKGYYRTVPHDEHTSYIDISLTDLRRIMKRAYPEDAIVGSWSTQ